MEGNSTLFEISVSFGALVDLDNAGWLLSGNSLILIVMAGIEEFVAAPCEEFLERCTRDQLLKTAEEYDLDLSGLGDKRRKENLRDMVKSKLFDEGVLAAKKYGLDPSVAQQFSVPTGNLTFEQQKELFVLQLSYEKEKQMESQRIEMEKHKMEFEKHKLEMDRQVEIERLRREAEHAKIALQTTRLGLGRDGKLPGFDEAENVSLSKRSDVVGNLRLLPKFNEKDPDVFFSLFERIARSHTIQY